MAPLRDKLTPVRSIGRILGMIGTGGLFLAAVPLALALPDPNAPIDPAKRASVSTADAVRPSAKANPESPFANARIIRMNEIPLQTAPAQKKRAPVEVRETRGKKKVATEQRTPGVQMDLPRSRAMDQLAAVPRFDERQFRKVLREYEEGRIPADTMLSALVQPGADQVDIGEINRFANPRRTLEAQGIPVIEAGSGKQAAPAESTGTPVPAAAATISPQK
jgi:hypothetical protein